jgi:hypothetical protein
METRLRPYCYHAAASIAASTPPRLIMLYAVRLLGRLARSSPIRILKIDGGTVERNPGPTPGVSPCPYAVEAKCDSVCKPAGISMMKCPSCSNAAVSSTAVLRPMLEERRWTVLGRVGDMNRHMRRGGGLEYKNSRTPSTIEASSSPSLIRRIQQLSHIDYRNLS